MHAKPDLRVVLKWMIAGSGSVIADVITLRMVQMQFELRTLIEFVTACSVCLALIVPYPVAALSLSTLLMLAFALLRCARLGRTGVGHMTVLGALTSFGWMMFFGFGTMTVYCLYCRPLKPSISTCKQELFYSYCSTESHRSFLALA